MGDGAMCSYCRRYNCICSETEEEQPKEFSPTAKVIGEPLPDRLWIAAYTAGDLSGVLSRGLYFRSIHNSKEDAELVKIYPNALGPEVQEYVKADSQNHIASLSASQIDDLGIEIVDSIRGYTAEFAPSKTQHEDEYDRVSEIIRQKLAT